MTIPEIITKLEAIRKRTKWLEGNYYNSNIPVEKINNILDQLAPTIDALRETFPTMLDGFIPHNYEEHRYMNQYNYNDNGKFYTRTVAHYIVGDIDYYLNIIPPAPREKPSPIGAVKVTKEGMFLAGQYFDALIKMAEIIQEAKQDLIIIDGYIDEKLLTLLTPFEGNVKVRILTKKISTSLQTFINNFNTQYKNSLEVKMNSDFHDRFVIVDQKEFYHIGVSIKDAGNRGFMFSQIEEPTITKLLLAEFNAKW